MLSARETETVYFVLSPSLARIKIGRSIQSNIKKRLYTIQNASPERLKMLKVVNGNRGLEKHLHARFRGLRLKNEWFHADECLMSYIEALRNGQRVTFEEPVRPSRDDYSEVLTTREAAAFLRIHSGTLRQMVRAGTLPCVRLGLSGKVLRFRKAALEEWMEQREGR